MTRRLLSMIALVALTACSSNALKPPASVLSGGHQRALRVGALLPNVGPNDTCPAGVNAGTWPDPDNDNLIPDGDFVGTPLPQQFYEYSVSIPSTLWKVPVGNIDLAGLTEWNNHSGPGGDCTVDLDGNVHGAISEQFATVAGTIYHVYFQFSGSTAPPLNINTMRVSAAGQSRIFRWNVLPAGHDVYHGVWERKTWKFTATGPMTTLKFKSLDPPGNQLSGAVITEILVEAPPG